MKAIWNETVVAESGHTVVVEGNHYFPPASLKTEYFRKSETHTTCPWKGEASYYDIDVNGKVNKDAAWYYPDRATQPNEIKDTSRLEGLCKSPAELGILKISHPSQTRFCSCVLPFSGTRSLLF